MTWERRDGSEWCKLEEWLLTRHDVIQLGHSAYLTGCMYLGLVVASCRITLLNCNCILTLRKFKHAGLERLCTLWILGIHWTPTKGQGVHLEQQELWYRNCIMLWDLTRRTQWLHWRVENQVDACCIAALGMDRSYMCTDGAYRPGVKDSRYVWDQQREGRREMVEFIWLKMIECRKNCRGFE